MMRVLNVTLVPEAGPPHERSVRREAQPLRRRWVERFSLEIAEQRERRRSAAEFAANGPFEEERKLYSMSEITLTNEVAAFERWTSTEIDVRQRQLAELAVNAW